MQVLGNIYQYFGARYYNNDISVWLSVDPLADKYPSTSAYMYTAGNPVMLVDPDGRKIKPTNDFVAHSSYYKVVLGLTDNGIFRKYAFELSRSEQYHWYLDFGEMSRYVSDADVYYYRAYTHVKFELYKNGKVSWGSSRTVINKEPPYDKIINNVAKAKTIIHEAIHAYLNLKIEKGDLKHVGNHHDYMANNLRKDIVKGIMEYVSQEKVKNISKKEIDILSWSGLTDTKAFNQRFNTERKIKRYYRKLEKIETKKLKYE